MQLLHQSTVYLTASVIVIAVIVKLYQGLRSPLSKVPGPWYTRWTSWVKTYHSLTGSGPSYVHSLHIKYGPVVRVSPNAVDVADLAGVQRIHRIKGEFLKSFWYTDLLPGVFNVFNTRDIDQHRRFRRLLSAPISDSGLQAVLPQVETKIRFAISRMAEEMKSRGAADVLKWWMFMATDIIGELSFGESFRMLEYGKKNQYISDLEKAGIAGAVRTELPLLWKISRYLPVPYLKESGEIFNRNRRYAEQSIQRHRTLVENGDMGAGSASASSSLFSNMYRANDDERLSTTEILDNAQAYIVAGSDTTANTLAYLVWAVCRRAEVRRQLAREVASLPQGFSSDDVRHLPYLRQVVDESLRLYPAAPSGLPRTVPAGGALLGGYWIPEGATATTQAYTLHRNPEAFPHPDRFDPSRWENPTQAMKESFMPFGGGSRVCLGLHLAYIEIKLAVAHFFRAFPDATVSSAEGMSDQDMEPTLFFLMSPSGHRCLIQAS